MNKTRKMPVSISFGDFRTKKNDFLIPAAGGSGGNFFRGLKTGEHFPYGAVSYIGREITASDIIADMCRTNRDNLDWIVYMNAIDVFLERLQAFKIGNIVRIEYDQEGDGVLTKVAERPPRDKHRECQLPG